MKRLLVFIGIVIVLLFGLSILIKKPAVTNPHNYPLEIAPEFQQKSDKDKENI